MNLWERLRGGDVRSAPIGSVDDYLGAMAIAQFQGAYSPGLSQTLGGEPAEKITTDFAGMAGQVFGRNSVVFACMLARLAVFSQIRFQWQRLNRGRPSELFGSADLSIFEEPWEGGTTADLLARMILDADLAGNSYWTEHGGELVRLRPDWTDIVLESRVVGRGRGDELQVLGSRRVGYLYYEGGRRNVEPVPLTVRDVAHYCPMPDPTATFRGMSWLTPLVREVVADESMTRHKSKFFANGATPNMIVKHGQNVTPKQAREFKAALDEEYAGADNAYRTMHVGGGADVTVVGANFQQLDFQVVQAQGETRIAAAAGTPPIIVGLTKGLESATYSNYGQARRRFADGTMHPLWGNAAGTLQRLRKPPGGGNRLWYDTRDVPFLREDSKDAAEIAETQARTMRTLVDGGYTPDSVQRAVMSGDFGLLEHSGWYSVQLRPPGDGGDGSGTDSTGGEPAAQTTDPTTNGRAAGMPPWSQEATHA